MPDRLKRQRFYFLSGLLVMLFSFPLLNIANKKMMAAGIPVLFLYLFISWAVGIVLLLYTSERRDVKSRQSL